MITDLDGLGSIWFSAELCIDGFPFHCTISRHITNWTQINWNFLNYRTWVILTFLCKFLSFSPSLFIRTVPSPIVVNFSRFFKTMSKIKVIIIILTYIGFASSGSASANWTIGITDDWSFNFIGVIVDNVLQEGIVPTWDFLSWSITIRKSTVVRLMEEDSHLLLIEPVVIITWLRFHV